ncbi:hypothetical protein [Sphingobium sp. YC-XJ3]|uniref:hypothetical protein n=1 Tax=Sphingobium sp. YC-XJ3 TaxID=3024245 RepID=UPI00236307C5|nr:hypothetical protein [Sphingobium sp. YC-XJ3]WDA36429.1 hypothetical protein PO876_23870 [Sphingobium sp. YC-XJ3]
MMASNNPSAFPVPNDANVNGDPGMTLRDWFAGQALAGMMASEAGIQPYPQDWAAERAFLIADAMLLERSKGNV